MSSATTSLGARGCGGSTFAAFPSSRRGRRGSVTHLRELHIVSHFPVGELDAVQSRGSVDKLQDLPAIPFLVVEFHLAGSEWLVRIVRWAGVLEQWDKIASVA